MISIESDYLADDSNFRSLDYKAILRDRIIRIRRLRGKDRKISLLKKFYANEPIKFIEDWITTFNSTDGSYTPFILYKRQREFVVWVVNSMNAKEDGLVDKCREVGVTHLCVAIAIWLFIFKPGINIGFASRSLSLVDKLDDKDAILPKARIMLDLLPAMFMPAGFDFDKDSKLGQITNRENGAVIKGEGGKNIGRGGRAALYFKDESAFYDNAQTIDMALSHTAPCKIDMSTSNGGGTLFSKKKHNPNTNKFIIDWRDDPRKDQEWYDKCLRKDGEKTVAREIDRDDFAATEDACIPSKFINAAIYDPLKTTMDDDCPVMAGLDLSGDGSNKNVLIVRKGCYVVSIHSWNDGNPLQSASKAYHICKKEKVNTLNFDGIGVGEGFGYVLENVIQKNPDFKFRVVKVNVGKPAPKNNVLREHFGNLKAYLWMLVRARFEKLHDFKNGNTSMYEIEELIFIPNHNQLKMELSIPKKEYNANGKVMIESKAKLKSRGIDSPDFADALMLAFHVPPAPVSLRWV